MGRDNLGKASVSLLLYPQSRDILKEFAWSMGYTWGSHGAIGLFLDAFAEAIEEGTVTVEMLRPLLRSPHQESKYRPKKVDSFALGFHKNPKPNRSTKRSLAKV